MVKPSVYDPMFGACTGYCDIRYIQQEKVNELCLSF